MRANSCSDDALLADLPTPLRVPHSRLNDLAADKLTAADYQVLTQATDAGVDIFARKGRSRFVFFQGHPEYDVAVAAAGISARHRPLPHR